MLNYNLILNIINIIVIVAVVFFVKSYLPSYFNKKGEYLATKEDISEITKLIESEKLKYSEHLKLFEAEQQRKSNVHSLSCGLEFQILSDIWGKIVELQLATLSLRPEGDFIDKSKSEDQIRTDRLKAFYSAYNTFWDAVQKNKPFYSEEIHKNLLKLISFSNREQIQYSHSSPNPESELFNQKYWDNAVSNKDNILNTINELCEQIRNRIRS
jgi:hypothetical protein